MTSTQNDSTDNASTDSPIDSGSSRSTKTGRKSSAQPSGSAAKRQKPSPAASGTPRSTLRVDLLPPMVETRRRQDARVRILVICLVGLLAITVAASFAMSILASEAENRLDREIATSQELLVKQSEYSELVEVKSRLAAYDDAMVTALFSEADWARIMSELDAALPEGAAMQSESITVKGLDSGGAPVDARPAVDEPGVIEVSFTASAGVVLDTTTLLDQLSALTGYVSATVSTVTDGGTDEGITIIGVVQLDTSAFGGTARSDALDEETLTRLRDELDAAVTAPADDTPTESATDTTTESGE